jgi:hypothetical protein
MESSDNDSSQMIVDLSTEAVDKTLMAEPLLYALAATLARVEHWVFDRERAGHAPARAREMKLVIASRLLGRAIPHLTPSLWILNLFVGLSSWRRFVVMSAFEKGNPALAAGLAELAYAHRFTSTSCAQFVHWLDVIQRSSLTDRIFSYENGHHVRAVLSRLRRAHA